MRTASLIGAMAVCLVAAGCGGPGPEAARSPVAALALPPARMFAGTAAVPSRRSNQAIAGDILDLTFRLESGRSVPVMTRFAGPVTVRLTGNVPPTAPADLGRLIARLRSEAGIDISLTASAAASVTIEFLPRRRIAQIAPEAACFTAPRIGSWNEYRRARRSDLTDWTTLTVRQKAAIFIPSDTAPQEIRDCLHEELAQTLGPLNDLYRLPDSVFNDDNMQGVLTGFDMLVLRVLYAPDLSSGMTEGEVAARLPALLGRFNPLGARGGAGPSPETPRAYITAIETAIGPNAGPGTRRAAAASAVAIAQDQGWRDGRAGFAWLVLGRVEVRADPSKALDALTRAGTIYRAAGMDLQAAHVDMQLSAFALSQGDATGALTLTASAIGPARQAQNAALLATLLMVRAEALDILGRGAEARAARMDSLGWAGYGFGTDAAVRLRLNEIAALSPARRSKVK